MRASTAGCRPRAERQSVYAASSAVQSSSSRRRAAWPGSSAFDHRPEPRRVVELDQVRDLVRDHVVGQHRRQLDQPPVEPDLAAVVAAAPLAARVADLHRRRGALQQPREVRCTRHDQPRRLVAKPVRRRVRRRAPRPAPAGAGRSGRTGRRGSAARATGTRRARARDHGRGSARRSSTRAAARRAGDRATRRACARSTARARSAPPRPRRSSPSAARAP